MNNNELIIAAAGSGKTTLLIKRALEDSISNNILITTYTEANEAEIRKKILNIKGFIPRNITIMTWFTFLLKHGVKPFQGILNADLFDTDISGMILVNQQSGVKYKGKFGPVYYKEDSDFHKHYFTKSLKIYSDKVSKFVTKCDKKSKGYVVDRISRIFDFIIVDEVQDLAGYDLALIKSLFKSSSKVLLVGDPRQVTYLTHLESKFKKYRNGKIKEFVANELGKTIKCHIDEVSLSSSHRNNKSICDFSTRLYPELPSISPCNCEYCRNYSVESEGIFIIRPKDLSKYIQKFHPTQLRWDIRKKVSDKTEVYNFGESKGLTFERVLIYPTDNMIKWLKNNDYDFSTIRNGKKTYLTGSKSKLYVAITRARYSVGFVYDYKDDEEFENIEKYEVKST